MPMMIDIQRQNGEKSDFGFLASSNPSLPLSFVFVYCWLKLNA